jgi:Transposase zinc-ribbon domain
MTAYTEPQLNSEETARKTLEAVLWPDGPVCPHCRMIGHA